MNTESFLSPMGLFWIAFHVVIVFFLFLDLKVFHREHHAVSIKEAAWTSVFWIGTSLLFAAGMWYWKDHTEATTFLTVYLLEKALSMDNLFVFYILFRHFKIKREDEHYLLFYGVVGAIIMRAVFIGLGVGLVQKFQFLLYIFGAFLLYSGIHMGLSHQSEEDAAKEEESRIVRFLRRFLRVAEGAHKGMWVRQNGKVALTIGAFAMITIQVTDLVFALDSIPAVLGITQDFFIAYTSNILAILGLRALYFLLAGLIAKFKTLHYGLSFVLVFIGVKMLVMDFVHIPVGVSLAVIFLSVGGTVVYDLYIRKEPKPATL